jgi:hypothetical protein
MKLLFLLFCTALSQTLDPDYHLITKGYWGSWKDYKYCPERKALCGINEKITGTKGPGDDVTGNSVMFKCCDVDEERWAIN